MSARILRSIQRAFHQKENSIGHMVQGGDRRGLEKVLHYPNKNDVKGCLDYYREDIELAALAAMGLRRPTWPTEGESIARAVMELIDHAHSAEQSINGMRMLSMLTTAEMDQYGKFRLNPQKMEERSVLFGHSMFRMVRCRFIFTDVLMDLREQIQSPALGEKANALIAQEQKDLLENTYYHDSKDSGEDGAFVSQIADTWNKAKK
jgi:hypothetical protein